ncbi:dicarboxylate/amino acid:cation symporter [Novosphingobium sp. JCM 18896]|uniref:dicarboxylate/amino acid:cation symporter n=1 Tax=Novosphingobium sp. JCM 18896 TaxID=2989731 RepID=UPI002223B5B6|nr:dicarboxylate/amino acid:cation symporter [Novosphingobium sp. JCM 18896]MCW1427823.1 dicarboxylate/amino acid:cation symporter [Novosphingobium sp. JCM 18896]
MDASARGFSLQAKTLAGFAIGLAAGLAVHLLAPGAAWVTTLTSQVTQPIGQLFLRLLFMLVLPLLFSALVVGVAELADIRALKRVGLKTLVLTTVLSSVAALLALGLVNLLQPGVGVDPALADTLLANARDGASAIVSDTKDKPSGIAAMLAIVPTNVFAAASANDVLAVMVFALFVGIGLVLVRTPQTAQFKGAVEGLLEISMKLIGLFIRLAPLAVACFMFNLAALFGWDLLARLSAYVAVVLLALGVQMVVVYSLAVKFGGGMSPLHFFRQSQEAMVMAFSTASSNATLPTSLRVAERNLGLPPQVARFVLTIGATANQNGTAIFEGVTVLFLAQFFGVDLSLAQQAMVLVICVLGGIGTAGVPAGSLPVIAIVLGSVGVPPEGIGLVLGVDRFLDMCRTVLNVAGDLAAAVVVSHGEDDVAEDAEGVAVAA